MSRNIRFTLAGVASLLIVAAFARSSQAGAAYSTAVLADNPVGYWRLNETSGAGVNSGSGGTGINGTYNNFPTGVRGANGLINANSNKAADFNGTQSAAGSSVSGTGLVSAVGGNPFTGSWTIEAWFVRNTQNDWSGIFSANNGGTQGPVMTFLDTVNGAHRLGINGTGATPNNVTIDLGAGSLGKKVYAAITKTGGNSPGSASLTVYANVDGTWMTPATGTNTGWTLTPNDGFYLGRHFSGAFQFHDGIIDEVAIYRTALSQAQLIAHYNAGVSLFIPEPSTLLLAGCGLSALAFHRRRRPGRAAVAA